MEIPSAPQRGNLPFDNPEENAHAAELHDKMDSLLAQEWSEKITSYYQFVRDDTESKRICVPERLQPWYADEDNFIEQIEAIVIDGETPASGLVATTINKQTLTLHQEGDTCTCTHYLEDGSSETFPITKKEHMLMLLTIAMCNDSGATANINETLLLNESPDDQIENLNDVAKALLESCLAKNATIIRETTRYQKQLPDDGYVLDIERSATVSEPDKASSYCATIQYDRGQSICYNSNRGAEINDELSQDSNDVQSVLSTINGACESIQRHVNTEHAIRELSGN